jgi:hypothetical protein
MLIVQSRWGNDGNQKGVSASQNPDIVWTFHGEPIWLVHHRGKTVTKPLPLSRLGLPLSEKQIPQVVENLESGGKPKEALERVAMRPRDRNRLQGLHRFSPNPNNYNNLGDLLFARQPTQDTSTDGVRAQLCHSDVGIPSRSSLTRT